MSAAQKATALNAVANRLHRSPSTIRGWEYEWELAAAGTLDATKATAVEMLRTQSVYTVARTLGAPYRAISTWKTEAIAAGLIKPPQRKSRGNPKPPAITRRCLCCGQEFSAPSRFIRLCFTHRRAEAA